MNKMELQKQLGATRDEMVGKRYRHFKGGIYVVLTIAVHNSRKMVCISQLPA